jgi:hypothetical protein
VEVLVAPRRTRTGIIAGRVLRIVPPSDTVRLGTSRALRTKPRSRKTLLTV